MRVRFIHGEPSAGLQMPLSAEDLQCFFALEVDGGSKVFCISEEVDVKATWMRAVAGS